MTDAAAEAGATPEPEPEPPAPPLELSEGLPALVETDDQLHEAVVALARGTGPIAVDTERASGYRYSQRAYLVQIRRHGSGTILVDPISQPDLNDLWGAGGRAEWIIHAASQDLPSLRMLGLEPASIFDTELAGRLLNLPRVGLGAMVESLLGKHMAKEHSAADWSKRPLPEAWLRYAALDVEVLVELRDILTDMLTDAGKLGWARAEFDAVLQAQPPNPRVDPWRRVSGVHHVRSRRGLAIVRELWAERERLAEKRDITPRRLLHDDAIVAAANKPPRSEDDLKRMKGYSGRFNSSRSAGWFAAIERAQHLQESDLPPRRRAPSDGPPPPRSWADKRPEAAARLEKTREAVSELAEEHNLPVENLVPPDAVRRLAWDPPAEWTETALAEELVALGARRWQADLVAAALVREQEREG